MKDDLCLMNYEKNHYVVMANDLIKGKQEMTLQEARVIRLLVTQVVKEDKDLKTYTCRIQDLAKFLGIDSSNLYRDIFEFCNGLLGKKVRIYTGNPKQPWDIFQWVQLARYDGNGTLTLMLSEQIKPFVIELNSYFTKYQLGNVLAMQSYYAIRLYELIKCQDGITREEKDFHEFSITYLREYFCCENKYKKIIDFKRKVIETAINEINDKTDMRLVVEYMKTGRAITSVRFYIHANHHPAEEQLEGQLSFDGI